MNDTLIDIFEKACDARMKAEQAYNELASITNRGAIGTVTHREIQETCYRALRISRGLTETLEAICQPQPTAVTTRP
jgi:hypothetical protein